MVHKEMKNMKIIQPRPFTFEAGNRAVLLLHAFTGHSADVRLLGRFLEKKNYTSHAPIYRGHGLPPEELLNTTPDDWWKDVQEGLQHLRQLGYEEIAVIGLSVGGLLGLKLAYSENVKAVIPMSTPAYFDNEEKLTKAFQAFAKQYKQLEQKDQVTIAQEMEQLMKEAPKTIKKLGPFIREVKGNLGKAHVPAFVIQPRKDKLININSATYIYNHIGTDKKYLKWYEESGHVITTGREKERLHQDIYEFLESLNWQN